MTNQYFSYTGPREYDPMVKALMDYIRIYLPEPFATRWIDEFISCHPTQKSVVFKINYLSRQSYNMADILWNAFPWNFVSASLWCKIHELLFAYIRYNS